MPQHINLKPHKLGTKEFVIERLWDYKHEVNMIMAGRFMYGDLEHLYAMYNYLNRISVVETAGGILAMRRKARAE